MSASRWHAPSVLICTTGTPMASMRWASIDPAMSPSITAGLSRPPSSANKASRSVVFPDPGEPTMFTPNTPAEFNFARFSAAS